MDDSLRAFIEECDLLQVRFFFLCGFTISFYLTFFECLGRPTNTRHHHLRTIHRRILVWLSRGVTRAHGALLSASVGASSDTGWYQRG
jgi:hypothetical protein